MTLKQSTPIDILLKYTSESNYPLESKEFALYMDENDRLRELRKLFYYPKNGDLPNHDPSCIDTEEESIYLCGHSLGLQPREVPQILNQELDKWAKTGVHGHFMGSLPWALSDERVTEDCSLLIGALTSEVAVMNALTVNLHILLISFYKPNGLRNKILYEKNAFPSDHYAFRSQVQYHGLNPDDCLIQLEPRNGEYILRTEDILTTISDNKNEIALICFSGVQYLTGQLFNIPQITQAGQQAGCIVGWDLAHAIGNVELNLHKWNVDFACWCSYKYLNSGAGGIGGIFVHSKHDVKNLTKLHGWWSHQFDTRFAMTNKTDEVEGASAFRISNPSILLTACFRASLNVFKKAGWMEPLRKKSLLLTAYLEYLLEFYFDNSRSSNPSLLKIITPKDPDSRGAQLSIQFSIPVEKLCDKLEKSGVVCDIRKSGVVRLAPIPLYNSFSDVYRFVHILKQLLLK